MVVESPHHPTTIPFHAIITTNNVSVAGLTDHVADHVEFFEVMGVSLSFNVIAFIKFNVPTFNKTTLVLRQTDCLQLVFN
jgi:hypothetical protein